MKVIIETAELAEFLEKVSDYYNDMTMYVLGNMSTRPHLGDVYRGVPEEFKKWATRFQEEHPRPSWKDVLPE